MLLTSLFSVLTAFSPAHAEQAPTVPGDTTPFLMCVKTCAAWYDQPGYGLQACLNECQVRYLTQPKMMRELNKVEPQFCETYEEPCDDDQI
ncbi:MAG: hypothetical protein KF681_14450 [Bdellovibrionaceae bacterium]|nr:hypothetical protein [Pseudobdellovibrionaceae bacterium]